MLRTQDGADLTGLDAHCVPLKGQINPGMLIYIMGGGCVLLHSRSCETYPVSFLSLQPYDIKDQMHDWNEAFDWTVYFGHRGVEVYKMVICGNDVILGVIALER